MKLENLIPPNFITPFRLRRLRLSGSLIGLFFLLLISGLHFFYPTFDRHIDFWIFNNLHEQGYLFFNGITELGNITLILPAAFILLAILVWKRKWDLAVHLTMIVYGGALFGFILKVLFSQSPNQSGFRWPDQLDLGFPSGHTMMAILFYGWITFLAAKSIRSYAKKIVAMIIGLLLIFLIGISRLMISVHQPTDVLSGWAAGGIWFILASWISRWLTITILPIIEGKFHSKS
jgi:membrane-associated phospholipid phosphatase